MKILKSELQDYLNQFSGEYREIFFETAKSFSIVSLNGNYKTPHFSTLDGFSVLSRTAKDEYFKVFSSKNEISEKILEFKSEFSLNNPNKKIELKGEDFLILPEISDINFDLKPILESYKGLQEIIDKVSFIKSSEISISLSKKCFVLGNTAGNFSTDELFYNNSYIKLLGERNGITEEVFEKIAGIDILEKFNSKNLQELLNKSIDILDKQLDAGKSFEGKIDVIIGNEAGGTIIHEAVGHGLEADLQNSSVYKDKIGQKVASHLVTVVDNPTTKNERGFYNFDHEGNKAQNTVLIENGVLKSYLHSEKTANKFQVQSTGHARRQTYKYKTLVRMGNTYLMPGNDKKEDLIKKVQKGLYVSRMGGGQVNTTTGDFVFKVQNGFLIENGELTKPVRGATLSGNGPEMLNEIFGICNDLNFFDGGTCGKGQSMPVSDGTPTILTKLKVSSI